MAAVSKLIKNSPSTAEVNSPRSESDQDPRNFLDGLEGQMKELWSQYVKCLDGGLIEKATALRNRYYNLYRCYRRNIEWKRLINN